MNNETMRIREVDGQKLHTLPVNGTAPSWEELLGIAGEAGVIEVEIAFYSEGHRKVFGADGDSTVGRVQIGDAQAYEDVLKAAATFTACQPLVRVTV